MASDNSPIHIKPIVVTAFIAVSILIGLKFVFDSYYLEMFEAEEYEKNGSAKPAELIKLHAAEAKSLASAPIPIDRAMALVSKGRSEPIPGVAADWITPQPSTDTASLVGWAQFGNPSRPSASASAAPSAVPVPSGSAAASATPGGPASSNAPPLTSAPPVAPRLAPPTPPAPSGSSKATGASTPPPAPAPSSSPAPHP